MVKWMILNLKFVILCVIRRIQYKRKRGHIKMFWLDNFNRILR